MRVGLTYDLRDQYLAEGYGLEETAEFDRPDTIDAIERVLGKLGFETDRIGHVRQLAARLCAGDRWDMVFNIAEGLYGRSRESQVPSLLEAYQIPCVFSDAAVLSLSLDKGLCVLSQHARAVDGVAAGRVLFEQRDVEPVSGKQPGGFEATRAAADDENVPH